MKSSRPGAGRMTVSVIRIVLSYVLAALNFFFFFGMENAYSTEIFFLEIFSLIGS